MKKNVLNNVVIIRLILIILLVFYHAFAIYSGGWPPIDGFPMIAIYNYLDLLSYTFMLESFVFISGYVFGYQVRLNGEGKLSAKKLFPAKFWRLIIPCAIFSLLYILLFGDIKQPLEQTLYGLVNGVAHMWFLPMLFWCFIFLYIIEKSYFNPIVVIIVSFVIAIIPYGDLPLRINSTLYYFPFFYTGYYLQRYGFSLDRIYCWKASILFTISFILLFFILTYVSRRVVTNLGFKDSYVYMIQRLCQLLYSTIGVFMLLSTVGFFLKKRNNINEKAIKIGTLCFGVYLFQQFILVALYNYTALPTLLGCYLLPWCGFFIALFGSIFFSYCLRKTSFGRKLI